MERAKRVAGLTTIGLSALAWVGTFAWYQQHPASFGFDYVFYRDIGERFLEGGAVYWPYQLAGSYEFTGQVDNLYPPIALLLFVPAAALPEPVSVLLWWGIPLGVLAYTIWRWRPSRGWLAVTILLLSTPRALSVFPLGNTDMWIAAAVAGGFAWGWPAVFVVIKPTLAPLALIGVRSRAWWVAAAVLIGVSLLMLPLWADYLTAMRNWIPEPLYAVVSIPLAVAPAVAWWGRTREAGAFRAIPPPAQGSSTQASTRARLGADGG